MTNTNISTWEKASVEALAGWRTTPYPLTPAFKANQPGVVPVEYYHATREYGSGQKMRVHAVRVSGGDWWCLTGTDGAWRKRSSRP